MFQFFKRKILFSCIIFTFSVTAFAAKDSNSVFQGEGQGVGNILDVFKNFYAPYYYRADLQYRHIHNDGKDPIGGRHDFQFQLQGNHYFFNFGKTTECCSGFFRKSLYHGDEAGDLLSETRGFAIDYKLRWNLASSGQNENQLDYGLFRASVVEGFTLGRNLYYRAPGFQLEYDRGLFRDGYAKTQKSGSYSEMGHGHRNMLLGVNLGKLGFTTKVLPKSVLKPSGVNWTVSLSVEGDWLKGQDFDSWGLNPELRTVLNIKNRVAIHLKSGVLLRWANRCNQGDGKGGQGNAWNVETLEHHKLRENRQEGESRYVTHTTKHYCMWDPTYHVYADGRVDLKFFLGKDKKWPLVVHAGARWDHLTQILGSYGRGLTVEDLRRDERLQNRITVYTGARIHFH